MPLKLHRICERFPRHFCSKREWPERVFSGIQPSGTLHIGNYFGAVKRWVDLQNENRNVMCSIVDLHAITLPYDTSSLKQNILKMTASLLACGVDPDKTILFVQSHVPHHTQLCWVLNCLTTLPRLASLPQYKEKSESLKDIPLGLYLYPVLQAADILLYKSTLIPIGEDQKQHLNFANHLGVKFNKIYGEIFPIAKGLITKDDEGCRIKNLKEPLKKMSKSHASDKSRLEILDDDHALASKVKKALTDSISKVEYDPDNRPGVSNLIIIHSLTTGVEIDVICKEAAALDTGQYKSVVAEALVEYFSPIRRKARDFLKNEEYLVDVLEKGAEKAEEIAANTWEEVRYVIGINPSKPKFYTRKKIQTSF